MATMPARGSEYRMFTYRGFSIVREGTPEKLMAYLAEKGAVMVSEGHDLDGTWWKWVEPDADVVVARVLETAASEQRRMEKHLNCGTTGVGMDEVR